MENTSYKAQRFKMAAFIVIVVLIGTVYIGIYQPKGVMDFFSTQVGPVQIITGEVNQENVQLKYPQVEGLADALVQNKINGQIDQVVHAFREPIKDKDHLIDTHYSLEFNKNNILSLTLVESHYRKMAAHPMHYMKAITVNTKNGQVYQLGDLFKSNSDYQARLTGIIHQQIIDKNLHLLKPFEGVKTDQEFYLTVDGVVIYYQLYDYTPYVYGFLKFNIPYDQLVDMMPRGFTGE